MRIVALDPGRTTGVCFVDWPGKEEHTPAVKECFFRTQLTDDHHEQLYEYLDAVKPDVLLYERFMYQRRDLDKGVALLLVSVEYIGVAKLWHQRAHYPHLFIEQQLSVVGSNAFWSDEKLTRLGLYLPGRPHANDATRHALWYISFTLRDPRPVGLLRGRA